MDDDSLPPSRGNAPHDATNGPLDGASRRLGRRACPRPRQRAGEGWTWHSVVHSCRRFELATYLEHPLNVNWPTPSTSTSSGSANLGEPAARAHHAGQPGPGFLQRAMRRLVRLVVALVALAVVAGAVLLGALVAAAIVAWALIRGRRPAAGVFRAKFESARRQRSRAQQGDIIDAEVREVPDTDRRPSTGEKRS
jgi:hypothetical protein